MHVNGHVWPSNSQAITSVARATACKHMVCSLDVIQRPQTIAERMDLENIASVVKLCGHTHRIPLLLLYYTY